MDARAMPFWKLTNFFYWSFGLDLSFPYDHDGIQKFTFPMNGNNPEGGELIAKEAAPPGERRNPVYSVNQP
jgi:hypothetical protein